MMVIFLSAIKVFVFDLFSTRGLPLVISVFSFGTVALVGSLTLKKWQAKKNRPAFSGDRVKTINGQANDMPRTGEIDSLSIE